MIGILMSIFMLLLFQGEGGGLVSCRKTKLLSKNMFDFQGFAVSRRNWTEQFCGVLQRGSLLQYNYRLVPILLRSEFSV